MKGFILALTAFSLLTGPVAAAPQSKPAAQRQCFLARDVSGWKFIGDKALNLQVNSRDVYHLDLFAPCPQLRQAFETIAIRTRTGLDTVCNGVDVDVLVPQQNSPPATCLGGKVTYLTPDQVKALPKRERP